MANADTSKAVGMHRNGEGRAFWVPERLVLVVLSHQNWLWCTKPTTTNLISLCSELHKPLLCNFIGIISTTILDILLLPLKIF